MIGWKPFSADWNVGSARLRSFLPCKWLRQQGWPAEIFQTARLKDYEIGVFQKAYTEEDVDLAVQLKRRQAKVVFDLCDNHFYKLRCKAGDNAQLSRLEKMIDLADVVSVSTPQLAKLIEGKPTVVVDDAVDDYSEEGWRSALVQMQEWSRRLRSSKTRLVWFGNAGTENPPFGLVNLAAIIPELNQLNRTLGIALSVISNSRNSFETHTHAAEFPVRYFEWDRRTFRAVFQQHDMCVLPIAQNPFTVCKTSNRVLLSLLLGVPVVADRIPSYEEFAPYLLFGDWRNSLLQYARNNNLGRMHVSEAQRYIRNRHSPDRVTEQWAALFNSLQTAMKAKA